MASARSTSLRDWCFLVLAALTLGAVLALLVSGIFQYAWNPHALDKGQVTMWMMPLLWVGIASLVFATRRPAHAWCWLLVCTFLVGAALFLLRGWW